MQAARSTGLCLLLLLLLLLLLVAAQALPLDDT
jgi:hypothetical protein